MAARREPRAPRYHYLIVTIKINPDLGGVVRNADLEQITAAMTERINGPLKANLVDYTLTVTETKIEY